MRGLGLAPEDRREVRIGIMRGWGTRHSGILTFMIWLYVIAGAVVVAVVVFVGARVHDVWVRPGGFGDWIDEHGFMLVPAVAAVVVFVWAVRPRRHRRGRYRRWSL
jgi:hypothetical protein